MLSAGAIVEPVPRGVDQRAGGDRGPGVREAAEAAQEQTAALAADAQRHQREEQDPEEGAYSATTSAVVELVGADGTRADRASSARPPTSDADRDPVPGRERLTDDPGGQ